MRASPYQGRESDDVPFDGLRKTRRAAAIVNVRTLVRSAWLSFENR